MNKNTSAFSKKIAKFITSFTSIAIVSGVSVAVAAITFSNTSITGDSSFNSIVGTTSTTWDIGATSTLSIQTTNSGPVAFGGSGYFLGKQSVGTSTLSNLFVIATTTNIFTVNSTTSQITFTNASGTRITAATSLDTANVSSTRITASTSLDTANVSSTRITASTSLDTANVSSTRISASTGLNGGRIDVTNVSSTNFSIGTGVNMTGFVCSTATKVIASVATTATTSIGFTLTGVNTSSNQVYLWGQATSTPGIVDLQFVSAIPSSTENNVDVFVRNISGAAFNPVTNITFRLCFIQF